MFNLGLSLLRVEACVCVCVCVCVCESVCASGCAGELMLNLRNNAIGKVLEGSMTSVKF